MIKINQYIEKQKSLIMAYNVVILVKSNYK